MRNSTGIDQPHDRAIEASAQMLAVHLKRAFSWHDDYEITEARAKGKMVQVQWVHTDKAGFAFVGLMVNRHEAGTVLVLPRKDRYQLWVMAKSDRFAPEVARVASRLAVRLGAPETATVHRGGYVRGAGKVMGRDEWERREGQQVRDEDRLICYEWPYIDGSDIELGIATRAGPLSGS